ncbi:unnamed protein product [Cyprideis torosa]|uniref:Dual specificity protein phosphatase n=1 Tax=Cyprideis torosa TaxID=163714 RepID=A0A7R8WD74_9CRUS|nr:unnamed protein product [Cyprideis torosa]CAG0888080.1 unnamed protein product [Cyprideis torosa]
MWRRCQPLSTVDELMDLITGPNNGHGALPTEPYNEVYPGLFVGNAVTALSTGTLRELGITHVLNAALGRRNSIYQGYVSTSSTYYQHAKIQFLGLHAMDLYTFPMTPLFSEASDFIDAALLNNGKVLVHCREGISRSATIAIAFLMLRRHFTVQEAVTQVRANREIYPNEGFLKQLVDLNDKLYWEKKNSGLHSRTV